MEFAKQLVWPHARWLEFDLQGECNFPLHPDQVWDPLDSYLMGSTAFFKVEGSQLIKHCSLLLRLIILLLCYHTLCTS